MKTVKVKTEERNFAIPGEPMTQAEFEYQYNLHPECKHLPTKGKSKSMLTLIK